MAKTKSPEESAFAKVVKLYKKIQSGEKDTADILWDLRDVFEAYDKVSGKKPIIVE
jgi:hypothetical protein